MIKSSKSCKNHKEDKMSENSKKEPKLRFPGFTDAWEQRELRDVIVSELKGKAKAEMSGTESVYLDAAYLNGGEASYVDSPKDVVKDDILILWDGSQAGTIYHGFEGALGSTLKAYKPKESGSFLYQYLKRQQQVIYESYRTPNIPHVVKSFTTEFKISVPEVEEQEKIGEFFAFIDHLITLHQRKLSDVQNLKAGLLQKMFPKNGANVPEIRFPEFTNFWERRKFKDFIKKSGSKNKNGEDYPAYSVSNSLGLIPQNEQFEGSRLDNLDKSAYKFVKPNEFAYNPARINVGSIAFNDLGKTVIVSSLYVIMQMSKELDNEFALQYIKSPEFLKEVRRNTEGSVREYLFYENFKNVKLPYTPNIEEQKKIGNFFKQLDHLITLHQRKLEHLQEQKKSLLQQMFV